MPAGLPRCLTAWRGARGLDRSGLPGRRSSPAIWNAAHGANVNGSKHGQNSRRWLPWAALGAALVVGGVIGGVIVGVTKSSASTAAAPSPATVSACAVTSVANQVLPSVVTISARGQGEGGTGSGEVIKSDGYILTNNHVIAVAANGGSVDVQFADGRTAPATITGRDPLTDLAVIKVDTSAKLKVIAMGESSSVKIGQPTVVIGSPLGLSGTVTSGIVSALDRRSEERRGGKGVGSAWGRY